MKQSLGKLAGVKAGSAAEVAAAMEAEAEVAVATAQAADQAEAEADVLVRVRYSPAQVIIQFTRRLAAGCLMLDQGRSSPAALLSDI